MWRIKSKVKSQKLKVRFGFTLVELIVVMSIIAAVAGSTVLISITGNLQRGRDTKRKADLSAIQSALEIYRSDSVTRAYPGSPAALSPDYMRTVPTDPKTKLDYNYSQAGTTYQLCANLENPVQVYCVYNP